MSRNKSAAPVRKSAAIRGAKLFAGNNALHTNPSDPPVPQRYVSRRKAAAYLGISVKTLIGFVCAREIPEYSLGRACKRYRIEDLEAYAQARRSVAKEAA